MTAEPRHFIDLFKLEPAALRLILDDARTRKAARAGKSRGAVDDDAPAAGRTLAMVFEKNSTRTRFSFDAAMRQLGGSTILANAADMQLGRGEPVDDTARVLSRMVDAVMIRALNHDDIKRFSYASTVPVINGLTDKSHPCQILADLLTFEEHVGPLEGAPSPGSATATTSAPASFTPRPPSASPCASPVPRSTTRTCTTSPAPPSAARRWR
jgi:ornithine carbamoyltransferase